MKKSIFLLVFAFIIAFPVAAQRESLLYQHKIEKFTHVRNAGWTMTGIGAGLAITGGILVATLPGGYWYDEDGTYYSSNRYSSGDDVKAFAGIISIGLGVGLLAGGITMGSIGSRKVKSYQSKLDNLKLGVICTPNRQGLTLTYRF